MNGNEQLEGTLYTNLAFKFSIRFPEGWKVKDGDGENVVKHAFGPTRGAMNVSIAHPDEERLRALGPDSLEEALNLLMESSVHSLVLQLAGEVVSQSLGVVNGMPAAYCQVNAVHLDHATGRTPMVFQQILCYKHGLIYMVTAAVRQADLESFDAAIKESFASFSITD